MHRPPPRRPRRLPHALIVALAALTGAAACGEGGDGGGSGTAGRTAPEVVAVRAQPCASPNADIGVGVAVLPGFVATAAHVVDGDRRAVTADGQQASVVAVDPRTDLALLAVHVAGGAPATTREIRGPAIVRTPAGDVDVDVEKTGPLRVDDTTAHATYEREVHTFAPGVVAGTSGAALLDERGRLAGIVVLSNRTDDTGYAVTIDELWRFVTAASTSGRGSAAPGRCPG